ncbi:ribosomal L7Ae/L30e/S12e/Gadd45 family protein [Feifania hominis]|uniref:Ribosomal L7Ae/L30e/S12e/Gadd45 family protein n=1 Tax=Feifania hominis TaxID=2763660 RepID=A0A926HTD0_9FIRM|nr:ribosomal L7Ae/L30e/S12e/Gadd45 family protein [Feifania hominis]MBC8535744.1 ribosomal L7Ae/L30e/S12e/Gadd45 family protein [Feifania hominis]
MLSEVQSSDKVVGIKQTKRAIKENTARLVIVAKDADEHMTGPIIEACGSAGIPVEFADSMRDLGHACGIEVGAAVVALLKG